METDSTFNVLDILKDPEFEPMLFSRLQASYDPTGPRSKTTKGITEYYMNNRQVFISDVEDFVKQDLGMIKSAAYQFAKISMLSLVKKVLFPAIGDYIDTKTGRASEVCFISNTNKNFSYDRERIKEYYKGKSDSGWGEDE